MEKMASEGGNTNDPTARRRRIAERGSDRLALITGGRPMNQPSSSSSSSSAAQSYHSHNASCPPSVTRFTDQSLDENQDEQVLPVMRKSESARDSASEPYERQSSPNQSNHQTTSQKVPKSDMQIYLYKTLSPGQLRPAILATQDTRRKCAFFAGIVTLLSHVGFPVLGNYIIRSIILSRPLFLLLLINITITVGPLLLDAMIMIQQEAKTGSSPIEVDLPDNLGTPFEWGMLFKTAASALFMDSCIYSVVIICGMSILQKIGL